MFRYNRAAMKLINPDIEAICGKLEAYTQRVVGTWQARDVPEAGTVSPAVLGQALNQSMAVLRRAQSDDKVGTLISPDDVSELGDYGLSLIGDLVNWADTLSLKDASNGLRWLIPELALWIARHGGELRSLESVVDSLAQEANREPDTATLKSLSEAMTEITASISPKIRADEDKFNQGRPWRVLLLNHCIVATRSQDTDAMRSAFDTLTGSLPEDAAEFFREGMQQMESIGYPDPVREVMQQYFAEWSAPTLH